MLSEPTLIIRVFGTSCEPLDHFHGFWSVCILHVQYATGNSPGKFLHSVFSNASWFLPEQSGFL